MNTEHGIWKRESRFWKRLPRFWERNRRICAHAALALSLVAGGAYAEEVDYDALFYAIAQVESDCGRTSANRYQLTRSFCLDLERITGETWDYAATVASDGRARLGMRLYWGYYAPRKVKRDGGEVTAELLAKLHNVGYVGLRSKASAADRYLRKVRRHYKPKKSSFSGFTPSRKYAILFNMNGEECESAPNTTKKGTNR